AWINAFKGGPASYGDFLLGGAISDAFNLAAISLRLGGRRLLWDAKAATITNVPEANKYLTREYRRGWEI
ncbi:MAG: gfo/Idh/MocA family oxidoreductase, partial [Acidobacteria bacterium]|nr:gfo/Idh/MocA family oxidoreductase [Acidobacteriota bacterium]